MALTYTRDRLTRGGAVNVLDFSHLVSGTDWTPAFQAAEARGSLIYVPAGTYRLISPRNLGFTKRYFGEGVLQFDTADHWRRGGSAGVGVVERYTIWYEFAAQADVFVLFDGVAQVITWLDATTVQAPASTSSVAVIVRVVNGKLRLGPVPETVASYNSFGAVSTDLVSAQATAISTWTGFDNTGLGARSLQNLSTGVNNTGLGSRALLSTTSGNNNTAIGFQALYRTTGSENTAVGSIAGEWLTTGGNNTFVGALSGAKQKTGSYNTSVGYEAFSDQQASSYCTAVGYRALANPSQDGGDYNTAVGVFAGDFCSGDNNTFAGYRAGCGPNSTSTPGSGNAGIENCYFGFFAGRNNSTGGKNVGVGVSALLGVTTGDQSVAVGHNAGAAITTGGNMVAIGFEALKAATASSQVAVGYRALTALTTGTGNTAVGDQVLAATTTADDNTGVGVGVLLLATGASNTAIGARALGAQTSATNNAAIGYEAGRFATTSSNNALAGFRAGRALTTGGDSVAIGADALQNETTGTTNTALGRRALRLKQDGTNQTGFSNCSGVGFDAACSASDQVQLGNSSTTTYAYGAVQARSDARDKTDVRDTALGIDFIMALRPVDFRWDYREDYENREPDGSRKRKRYHHGLIAQEVRAVMAEQGVDFGGFQDHGLGDGCDVLSLGYEELIAPLIRTAQQQQEQIKALAAEVRKLRKGATK